MQIRSVGIDLGKPSPLLILFLLLACALAAVFFYFTLGGQP
jgi:hypothetical protein